MMNFPDNSPLVDTAWLAANLEDQQLRVLDVRWRSRFEDGRGISFDAWAPDWGNRTTRLAAAESISVRA